MRTTLDVDDDVLAAARTLASEQSVSLGRALSELARRGLTGTRIRVEGAMPVFDVPADAPPITPDMVRAALDES